MPPRAAELLLASGVLFAWAHLPKLARAEGRDPRLLVIILRGALDGLAAVAPVGDPDWIRLRGDKALALDGRRRRRCRSTASSRSIRRCRTCIACTRPARPRSCTRPRRPIASARISTARTCWKAASPRPGATDTGWLNRALAAPEPAGRVAARPPSLRGRAGDAAGGARARRRSCHGRRRACRRRATTR